MKNLSRLLMLATVVFLLTACSASIDWARSHGQALNRSSAHFTNETETRSHTLTIRETMRTMDLELNITLDEGVIVYRLFDPDGVLKWENEAEVLERRLTIKESFTPVVGEWTLEARLTDASGEYELVWRGQ
jgi:hypothetical protein